MNFSVSVTGVNEVLYGLEQTIARSADLEELKDPLLAEYARENRENLLGEGSLVGGWKPLALSTVVEKARAGYGSKRIEERTGALFRSLTEEGADGFRVIVSGSEMTITHDLPYVAAQNETRQLIPEPDLDRYGRIFEEHAERVAREEGFARL